MIETIAKFFNDLIGALVPGAVLACGLVAMHQGPAELTAISKDTEGAGAALVMAGLLFALGHGLSALHEHVIQPLLEKVGFLKGFDEKGARERQSYKWFSEMIQKAQGEAGEGLAWSYNDLRSVALSLSSEAAALGRRFMFISLLCNGVAAALVVIAVDFLVCVSCAPSFLHPYQHSAPWQIQIVLLLLGAGLLMKRGESFYKRAKETPFAIVVAELKLQKDAKGIEHAA